jgi:hypothetical protein
MQQQLENHITETKQKISDDIGRITVALQSKKEKRNDEILRETLNAMANALFDYRRVWMGISMFNEDLTRYRAEIDVTILKIFLPVPLKKLFCLQSSSTVSDELLARLIEWRATSISVRELCTMYIQLFQRHKYTMSVRC